MRIALKILTPIIMAITLVTILVLAANAGKLNRPIKNVLEYFLQLQGIEAKLIGFKFKDGVISTSQLSMAVGEAKIEIYDLHVGINYSQKTLSGSINPGKVEIISAEGTAIAEATYNAQFSAGMTKVNKYFELKLSEVSLKDPHYDSGTIACSYKESARDFDLNFSLSFADLFHLNARSKIGDDKISVSGKNIPLMLHSLFQKIAPTNGLVEFFNDFVKSGYISELDFSIGLKKKQLLTDELAGGAKIQQLDLSYNKDLPMLKNMDVDVKLNDSNINFYINRANSSEILLSDGIITMDWQGLDKTILKVKAKGSGPARGLTDFIAEENHKTLQRGNIDLRKIVGNAEVDIDVDIPLKPGTTNTYNITATLPKTSLSIFKDNVRLAEANIAGIFDGNQVRLTGNGKINGFKSDLSFIYNLQEQQAEFGHKLDIKTHFKAATDKSTKGKNIAFISLLSGESIIDFSYVHKNSIGIISVDSDITGLDLYFDKLGIHKKKNDKARILIDGTFTDPTIGNIGFNVNSHGGLKVKGNVSIKDGQAFIGIPELKNKGTNLSAELSITENLFAAYISGKMLDLSGADMLQFLEKERDKGNTKLRARVKKVKLKSNVWLDDLDLMFECDNLKCHTGFIDSKIGSKSIEMLLTAKGEKEEWLVTCHDAGALLRGLGMYDSMKNGSLVLNISTSRKEVKPGQIIPIHSGKFAFERFALSDTPAIIRLVSFISVPGFLSIISGNKDIGFTGMKGDFSFQNNILTINNSFATGPYFDFTLKGAIDTQHRMLDIYGYVNPSLYGISSVVGAVPIIGRIFTGNSKHRGLVSQSYKLRESY
ncbi:MAG: DUF3971 domain-containing protein [Rickettsiaceae bacterium]